MLTNFCYAQNYSVIFEFDMVDVSDNPDNEWVQLFPGAKVWERSTLFLRLFRFVYPAIRKYPLLGLTSDAGEF